MSWRDQSVFLARRSMDRLYGGGKTEKGLAERRGGRCSCRCRHGRRPGASWGQGIIVFAPTARNTIHQVSEAGGNATPITRPQGPDISHRMPELLPGSAGLLFATWTTTGGGASTDGQVAVQSLKTGERHQLIQAGNLPRTPRRGTSFIYRAPI